MCPETSVSLYIRKRRVAEMICYCDFAASNQAMWTWSRRFQTRGSMKMMRWLVVPVIVSAGLSTVAAAQQPATRPDLPALFDKKDVMIPVRDGVKLHTEIYTPRDAKGPLPIFIERSPYGISAADKGYTPILYRYSEMFADGYVFVFQDIRGRYGSESKIEIKRAAHDQ